jgi:hypothetical protein
MLVFGCWLFVAACLKLSQIQQNVILPPQDLFRDQHAVCLGLKKDSCE